MKWIKASDRLPDVEGQFYINAAPYRMYFNPDPDFGSLKKLWLYNNYEWLDESPATPTAGMEEVLDDYGANSGYPSYYHKNNVLQAMSEFASIQCAERDREIAELRKQLASFKLFKESADKIIGHQSKQISESKTVDSEREMNAILTEENATQSASIDELVQGLEKIVGYENHWMAAGDCYVEMLDIAKQLLTKHKPTT